jgi:hypothetical protein
MKFLQEKEHRVSCWGFIEETPSLGGMIENSPCYEKDNIKATD